MESGSYYKINKIFSDDIKVVIPDMQRDYCWSEKRYGNKKDSELVTQFIESLFELSEDRSKSVQMGMIYGYEADGFVYLCDGQQRLTTLYLTCGMLYRNLENVELKNRLQNVLISEYEISDDQEPRLQYAIRESSLYFLRNLVWNYFIKNEDISPNDIFKKADWFYTEYKLDPTALNMVSALGLINKVISNHNDKTDQLARFILDQIQFLYYDMKSRKDGEDQFVVINTTGDPLTFTEIIKPYLLRTNVCKAEVWEEMDTYFWKNRGADEQTSDQGMYEFLNMYLRIIKSSSTINLEMLKDESIGNVDTIYNIFKKYKLINDWLEDDGLNFKNVFRSLNIKNSGNKYCGILRDLSFTGQKQQQKVLLPLLAAMHKYEIDQQQAYTLLRRLRKNYYSELFDERRTEYLDWHLILSLIDNNETYEGFMTSDTLHWYTKYEHWRNSQRQLSIEELENMEDDKDFMGDISPIVFYSELANAESIRTLYSNYNSLTSLFGNDRKARDVEDFEKQQLLNEYRLFRFFVDNNKAGHADYQPWEVETVKFSCYNRYKSVTNAETWKLCSNEANSMLSYLIAFNSSTIKECNIFDKVKEGCNTQDVLTGWLSLKLLDARKQRKLLSTYDNYGVTCLVKTDGNRITSSKELSIYNVICGYSHRNEWITYAIREIWDDSSRLLFDNTCGNILTHQEFWDIRKGSAEEEIFEKYRIYIEDLISEYM